MEWSWLKDWWRLKKLRRNNQLMLAANRRQPHHHPAHASGQVAGDLGYSDYDAAGAESGGQHSAHPDYYYGGGGGSGGGYEDDDGRDYDGDEDICFCDDCMNVRIFTLLIIDLKHV